MEAFIALSIFSVAMFFGSYLAGSLPLIFSLSPSRLQLVTALGAGLLVGTALTVIIPEGMDTIMEEVSSVHEKDLSASSPPVSQEGETLSPSDHDHPGSHELPQKCHVFIGVSMALGFVFMLLVDQLAGSHHTPSSSVEAAAGEVTKETRKSFTATIGLVIHSAADGIALGAAASAANTELEIVIFVAIMLHKAPAGFGLVSFLMHEGCDRKTIRCHLLAFSLAAPIAAFVSHYCFINIVYSFDLPITGLAMLFSAGTFLYVATVHVLTEIGHHRIAASQNGQSTGTTPHTDSSKLTLQELTAVICGILMPIVFNIFHAH